MSKKIREVVLPRWHSGRWLLSPDLFRAYDHVWMHPKDAESIEADAGQSTYNEWEAENLAAIREMGNLLIIKKHPAHIVPSEKKVERMAHELLELPVSIEKRPAVISLYRLKNAVIHAHRWWIDYNQSKLMVLQQDEEYAEVLKKDLLPNCRLRIKRMIKCPSKQFPKLIQQDDEIRSTYTRLVASTLRMVHGADKGIDIFDHMLPEYMPMITYYEHYRLIKNGQWNPERRADQIQVVARWTKMRKGAGTQFDDLESFLERFEYADSNIELLRRELLNLDILLKEFKTLPVEARWINDWCQKANEVLLRIEQSFKTIHYGKWVMAMLGFFGGLLPIGVGLKTLSVGAEAALIVSETPGIETRIRPVLTRLALAAYGMPGSSGRYVLLASNSMKSLKGVLDKRDYIKKQISRQAIEDHFLPYINRLEGSERAHKVVP